MRSCVRSDLTRRAWYTTDVVHIAVGAWRTGHAWLIGGFHILPQVTEGTLSLPGLRCILPRRTRLTFRRARLRGECPKRACKAFSTCGVRKHSGGACDALSTLHGFMAYRAWRYAHRSTGRGRRRGCRSSSSSSTSGGSSCGGCAGSAAGSCSILRSGGCRDTVHFRAQCHVSRLAGTAISSPKVGCNKTWSTQLAVTCIVGIVVPRRAWQAVPSGARRVLSIPARGTARLPAFACIVRLVAGLARCCPGMR